MARTGERNMPSSDRSSKFIEQLYHEKEIHKDHRHKHVLHKLILTGTFFGLGQVSTPTSLNHLFLYIVPFVALVHDAYIFAEHFKVHRIGLFLRILAKSGNTNICSEENEWEEYLKIHMERYAY
jgi:hypothetical protein